MEFDILRELLSSGADLSLIVIAVWMLKQDKRILILEIKTGIRKLTHNNR